MLLIVIFKQNLDRTLVRTNNESDLFCVFDSQKRIRLPKKFLSFHMVIIDEQQFLFYIILLN